MKTLLVLATVAATSAPPAGGPPLQPIQASLRHAVIEVLSGSSAHRNPQAAASQEAHRTWVAQHPVLTGTLVGFGAGFAIGAATCRYPGSEGSCSEHTFPGNARALGGLTIGGIGAGIGAAAGALIGR